MASAHLWNLREISGWEQKLRFGYFGNILPPFCGVRTRLWCTWEWRSRRNAALIPLFCHSSEETLPHAEQKVIGIERQVFILDCPTPFWGLIQRSGLAPAQYSIYVEGLVCVPIYDTFGDEAVRYIIEHSELSVIVGVQAWGGASKRSQHQYG